MPLNTLDRKLVRSTTIYAGVAAFMIGLLIPVFFFTFGYRYSIGHVDAEAHELANEVSHIITRNPDYWRFEVNRIKNLIAEADEHDEHDEEIGHERAILLMDADRQMIFSYPENTHLTWPVLNNEVPIYEFGTLSATIVLRHSLHHLMLRTIGVAILSAVLAFLIFWSMRLLPLRALQNAVGHIAFMANHDDLTQLPNRRRFNERLNTILEEAKLGAYQSLTVMIIDLDRFKDVNDTLGHHVGDQLLMQASQRISDALDDDALLARLSGDEFAVIHTKENQPSATEHMSNRIIEKMAKPFNFNGVELSIGASIGIAQYPQNGRTATAMLLNADAALYRAKQDGRSRYCFFDRDMQAMSQQRRTMKRDLQTALVQGQFEMHYQPQVNLRTNQVVGVEALLRWHHPTRGTVSPADFIPLAEESSLIFQLGEFVLRQACTDACAFDTLSMAVNVSPCQFRQADLASRVAAILEETGLEPGRLQVEITEGVLLQDTDSTLQTLKEIKSLGVHVAMDDFGTGYSSLSYLRMFAFDKIKIDRSFVNELGFAEDADAIVRAAINLAQSLGIRTNAEGAETADQAAWLDKLGCEEVQGYHFGRPVRVDNLRAAIDRIESTPQPLSRAAPHIRLC